MRTLWICAGAVALGLAVACGGQPEPQSDAEAVQNDVTTSPLDVGKSTLSTVPSHGLFTTDGVVTALARLGDRLYLGGAFSAVGPETGPFAAVSRAGGLLDRSFPRVAIGQIKSLASDGVGGFYIAGTYSWKPGVPKAAASHLFADGSIDPAFSATLPEPERHSVLALTRAEGELYLIIGAGQETSLVGLDAGTGSALGVAFPTPRLSWGLPSRFSAPLAATPTRLYAAVAPDVTGNDVQLASFDRATGTLETVYSSGGTPRGLVSSGSVMFSTGDGVGQLFGIDSDTDEITWRPQEPSLPEPGLALALSDDGATLFRLRSQVQEGPDSQDTGVTQPTQARITALEAWDVPTGRRAWATAIDGTSWYPADGAATPYYISDLLPGRPALVVSGGTVHVSGAFRSAARSPSDSRVEQRMNFARFDATTGALIESSVGFSDDDVWPPNAYSLLVTDKNVLLAGSFNGVRMKPRSSLAAFDLQTGRALDFKPRPCTLSWNGACGLANINDIVATDTAIFVAGNFVGFRAPGGGPRTERRYVAALDPADGQVLEWNAGLEHNTQRHEECNDVGGIDCYRVEDASEVSDLELAGSTLAMAGSFTQRTSEGVGHRFAAVNAQNAAPLAVPMVDRRVRALASDANTLYLGGDFTRVGSVPRQGIAALDRQTLAVTTWAPDVQARPNGVSRLAVGEGKVYVVTPYESPGIATVDAATAAVTDFGWTSTLRPEDVTSLTVLGARLIVTARGCEAASRCYSYWGGTGSLFDLDAASGEEAFRVDALGPLFAVAPWAANALILGGGFTSLGGWSRSGVARLSLPN